MEVLTEGLQYSFIHSIWCSNINIFSCDALIYKQTEGLKIQEPRGARQTLQKLIDIYIEAILDDTVVFLLGEHF